MTGTKAGTTRQREARLRRKHGEADPEQYARFLEAAREHGCEENLDRLDDVVRRAAKLPPPRQKPSRAGKGKNADK